MKVAIYGAGAIGGLIGGKLALAGEADVSALARGATLSALQQHGWRVRGRDGLLRSAPARARSSAGELGPQDVVIVAVKGPAMAQVAEGIGPLLGPNTAVVPAMNGVPWWFTEGLSGPAAAGPLQSLDATGRIAAAIPARRVIGCVVHLACAVTEPGRVEHRMGQGLILGEPDGSRSERAATLAGLLSRAGFDATVSPAIRRDIWFKLWGNLTINPVSAITGATADRILDDPLVREFCSAAMREAAAIGARIGCAIDQRPDDRHQVTRRLGAFKTSMLQDAEAGRALELDAIVAAVRELGLRVGEPTPNIDALFGLTRLFARVRGLYADGASEVPHAD